MASRAQKRSEGLKSEDISELLDELQGRIDRCKVLYEQYFLGIQRTAPNQLQRELERRIRELTQGHIRNTGMRFRFTTLSQKFASYNTYWNRTLKEIEAGTYARDMARVGREAVRTGKDIPEELLAKMPKRMRERILKDRDQMRERAKVVEDRESALRESGKVRDSKPRNVHQLDESDLLEDLDLDSIFSNMMSDAPAPGPAPSTPKMSQSVAAPEASKDQIRTRGSNTSDTDVEQLLSGAFAGDASKSSAKPAARPAPAARVASLAAKAAAPERPPAPSSQRSAPEPVSTVIKASTAKPPPGMSEAEGKALYQRYKKARELVGESTTGLSYNKLMNSLNKQAPQILKQHKAKGVSFDVVVKGDRVVLKAKPHKA